MENRRSWEWDFSDFSIKKLDSSACDGTVEEKVSRKESFMKRLMLSVVLGSACMILPFAAVSAPVKAKAVSAGQDLQWNTDMRSALVQAQKLHKEVLVNFTGSDWCGWCIRLDKEVFSTGSFRKYAAKNLVLLKIDFPRNKWQTPAERKANMDLARKYGVQGYPTILLLNSKGDVIARTGYRRGGAAAYIRHLQKLLKAKR
jgi:protein disulfide-isomerase